MFNIIPVTYYYHLYYNLILFIVLLTLVHNYALQISDTANVNYLKISGIFLFVFILGFLGFRPVHHIFVDMFTYARRYDEYQFGSPITLTSDITFEYFMKFCSYFLDKTFFFALCAFLYVTPLLVVSIKFFKDYWFYSFLMLLGSYSFLVYGVNGIRNGIATSFFLLALAYKDNKLFLYGIMIVSILFHKSMVLPVLAYLITQFYNNPKSYILFWIISIPISLILGSLISGLFTGFGFVDERFVGYLMHERGGFRWDFLVYSSFPIIVGSYFIYKKHFKDRVFIQLFNVYAFCNAFWIFVIRISFSNRLAYLSWFLMGIILIYPYITQKDTINKNKTIGKVIFAYFAFAYFMFLRGKI